MHLFYLREAWRSIKQHRGLATTGILSLTAALTLSGLFLLLAHNAQIALKLIGDRREMVVYLREDASPADRDSLIARLNDLYGAVTYVSKAAAWDEFKQEIGDPALLEAVGPNPLPASLRVRLKPELLNFPAMQEAARQVSEFPEVEDVRYGAEWVRRLDDLGTAMRRGAIGIGAVVALAILFILYNTIRLTVLARRPQVEIMSRLGAADRFIAAPFVLEAILEALIASLLALGTLFALQQTIATQMVTVVFFSPLWIAGFVGASVALAWFAASLALSRVLRAVGP
jgi:cell division transport system permease protein